MHALILELDAGIQAELSAALTGRGHQVSLCQDLASALARLERSAPPIELLIVGQAVDGPDILHTCRVLRAQIAQPLRACGLLLLARDHTPTVLAQAFGVGIDDYLVWPLAAPDLALRLTAAERLVETLTERQMVEAQLGEAVERFDLAARGSNDGLWDAKVLPGVPWYSPETLVWYSERMKELMGYAGDEIPDLLESWARLLHPEDRDRIFEALRRHIELRAPYDVEYRLLTKSGEYRWFSARGKAIWDEQGQPLRMSGSLRDITPHKQQEEALQNEQRVLRQLLEMTERDRRLMAYEIHDGLVQYVTGALMHLEVFALKQPIAEPRGRQEFDFSLRLLRESVDEARRLISGLRPPILDESGIVPAIEYLLHEQRGSGGLVFEFIHDVEFDRLAPAVESALFRIAQEALSNVRRHSKSQRARVELIQVTERLRLVVQDSGVGFDTTRVPDGRYGLQGIRERARLLEGGVQIESQPGQGTRITVELPLIRAAAPVQSEPAPLPATSTEPCAT
jgi:two-component system sensor histidine kinase UhpB